ncbi:AraC family transcriptional regulator [bacterium]|nr:AraC family transcriptional regulator [bacterium]MDY4582011.1 AraC family transcriptional regulator [Candidatus Faecousia sp.]
MNEELLDSLRIISPEEKALLDGSTGIQRGIYMDADSDVIDAGRLLDSGRLITIRPHTRFAHFPEHSHNYVEMVYMCCGSTTQIANGKQILLHEGELLLFGQGARQEILPAGENDIAVNFLILPQFFDKVLEMLDEDKTPLRKFIMDSLGNSTGNTNCLYFQVADVLPIQNLIENLIWTLLRGTSPNRRSICQTTMGLLFMQLMNYTDRLVSGSTEEAAIVKVLRYIEENYRTGSLTEIADTLHYDLYWLSREIKRRTGKTYKELLQEKRLTQAAYFLKHTSLRVEEVGEAVGYRNLSYFHRIFQERYGVTPKKYRSM